MTTPKLELVQLSKSYPHAQQPAVDRIDLAVMPGETLALLGPSGCGKSTTLNMIVGLEAPSAGDLRIDGRSVLQLPAGKRDVGLVFQDYAVFPSLTVRQNLAFGLSVRGVDKRERARVVCETAALLGLTALLDTSARELGGSELQRVAIGRTLAVRPKLLLLDEPLSNLEPAARLTMRKELRRLQAETGLTIVYVTHDQIEALSLARRIAVMREGRICQVAETQAIYARPEHTFVASFLGTPAMNLLHGTLAASEAGLSFACASQRIELGTLQAAPGDVVLGIRAESLRLIASEGADWVARVIGVERRGEDAVATVESAAGRLQVIVSGAIPRAGELVGVQWSSEDCVWFEPASGARRVA